VLVGRAAARSHLEDDPPEKRADCRKRQRESITGVFEAYNPEAPTVFDCEFGHTYQTCLIPTGGEVEIDPATESIRFP
jgi:muramoyltetrapeptide carboxypeptidase LdcA involved in peptidoglycan recycling